MKWLKDLMRLFPDVTRISRRPGRRRCALDLEPLEVRVALSTFVVSNLNDGGTGSLRQAIAQADGTPGPNEIDFATGLGGTITLTGGQLTIANNDLTIVGPGADQLSVSGQQASRVFEVDAVSAALSGLTITDGSAPSSNNNGGGIYNNGGTLTIAGCALRGNSAGAGGGLYNNNAATTITDSTISDNGAAYGGGLYNNSYNHSSLVTITDSTISGNTAATSGGGFDNNNGGLASNNGGTISISDSTISGNTTSGTGGGLHSYGGMLTIAGSTFSDNAAAVDGGGLYSVGKVGSLVTITGSTISTNAAEDGGGLSNNGGAMLITDSTIRDNSATGGADAGGIDNYTGSTLTILRSTISGNSVGVYGGGIDNIDDATATIVDSTIRNNHADGDGVHSPLGGGIYSYNATVILANSTLSDNAAAYGSGLYNNSYNHPSLATITDSTIRGNTALQGGGGIDNNNGATLTIAGSTISGNSAGNGGGVHNYNGTVRVVSSTISDNAAGTGGGLANNSGALTITGSTVAGNSANDGGGIFGGGTSFQMRNTILAGNMAGTYSDLDGRLNSSGYNLVEAPVGGLGYDPTDLLGVDPLLGPLQDNGGPTPTMALQPSSPALNAGAPDQLGTPDQRGVVRSGGVNIGAYQASATAFVLSVPAKVTAGVPFSVTVTAVDPFGQVAVGYAGTVSFNATDPDPRVVLPADYTFTSGDAGVHTFTDTGLGETTLLTCGYQTITVTDTADGSITGCATVKVKHLRRHHDLPAALGVAAADRFFGSPDEFAVYSGI